MKYAEMGSESVQNTSVMMAILGEMMDAQINA
jgi:hypothetical protein